MKLIERDVRVVRVIAVCDQEGCNGLMVHDGSCLTVNPPLYPHVCDQCGRQERCLTIYPSIEYR